MRNRRCDRCGHMFDRVFLNYVAGWYLCDVCESQAPVRNSDASTWQSHEQWRYHVDVFVLFLDARRAS